MEYPKKQSTNQKPSFVKEPETIYEAKQEIIQQKNTPEQEILLQKLLALGLKQSEMGLGQSHEEVMAEIKKKYNLPLNV
jgi:hypothetical protein